MQNTWWIGRSCKRREAFRRAVLIGRALAPILPAREGGAWNGWILRFGRHAAPRAPGFRRAGESALHERDHRGGDHPVPSRTRQLSPPSPRVLQRQAAGGQGVALAEGAFLYARRERPAGEVPLAGLSAPCGGRGFAGGAARNGGALSRRGARARFTGRA